MPSSSQKKKPRDDLWRKVGYRNESIGKEGLLRRRGELAFYLFFDLIGKCSGISREKGGYQGGRGKL